MYRHRVVEVEPLRYRLQTRFLFVFWRTAPFVFAKIADAVARARLEDEQRRERRRQRKFRRRIVDWM